METIGLRELNQNPSRVVTRIREGASILVTDRGRPLMRITPADDEPSLLQQMVRAGEAKPPREYGMPDLIPGLGDPDVNLSDMVIAEREKDRNR